MGGSRQRQSPGAAVSTRPAGIEWYALAAGLLLTLHYSWILDDAYVYFRYVDNLLFLGNGLVFNRGEYVEGFSSPAWALLLIGLRATRLDYWLIVRAFGLLSFAVFGLCIVRLNRALSPRDAPVVDLPLLYLSFNYAVLSYFTSGTESPLVQILAVVYALLILHPGSRTLQIGVALSPLVRPELGVPFAACVLWVLARRRALPWPMLLVATLSTGGWLAFRVIYYADLLPNTFYLKNGTNVHQGLVYLRDGFVPYGLPALLLAGIAVAAALRLRAPAQRLHVPERAAMLAVAALATVYVVKVGGDSRHYRYLAFPFCLATCSLAGLAEGCLCALRGARRREWAIALGLLVGALSFSAVPRQLYRHPVELGSARIVDGIGDAANHRNHPRLPLLRPWRSGRAIDFLADYRRARANGPLGGYTDVVTGFICFDLYAHFDALAVHSLGLTDPLLARVDMPAERPGHKLGLMPLAEERAAILRWWGRTPAPGMHRAARDAGVAPAWVADNLETIEIVERKEYNRHHLRENLALALQFPERISVPGSGRSAPGGDPGR